MLRILYLTLIVLHYIRLDFVYMKFLQSRVIICLKAKSDFIPEKEKALNVISAIIPVSII